MAAGFLTRRAARATATPQSWNSGTIVDRERTGVAVNLDFRPDEDNEYYLRSLFSNFKDTEERRRNQFTFEDGYAAFLRG